ncbi:CD177 antigen-like [Monodelphis domestica]|uniref:CD177 antigen-like n=1 Tax=Monodelphis domestica TaxID=13616 RepID=UPI0024E26491|nr:CD177 antigen-like [Monodelphis domestica]
MGLQLLLWLLGAGLTLRTQALVCKRGFLTHADTADAFPISWTVRLNETCEPGQVCQETLILLQSGNKVAIAQSQGCTGAQAQAQGSESQDIQHRAPPGVTIASYTRVCHSDLCNDLSNSVPLWTPTPTEAPAPGGLQCPVCLAFHSCPSNAPLVTCPSGTTHCYSGTIRLSGGGLSHPLRVQGCVPHDGCQLLNGTKAIGPITLTERCESGGSQSTRALACFKGNLFTLNDRSDLPLSWTANLNVTCQSGEGCQDTLILIQSGDRVMTAVTKGCKRSPSQEPLTTEHQGPPGITIASYTHVCHSDLCNDLDSNVPLWDDSVLPDLPGSGDLRCPVCLSGRSCPSNSPLVTCPLGTSHCYSGTFQLVGGGLANTLNVQGCASRDGCQVPGGAKAIGPVLLKETCKNPKTQGLGPQTTPGSRALTCYHGTELQMGENLAKEHQDLSTDNIVTCGAGELCQETVLFIESGSRGIIVSSKGCTAPGSMSPGTTRFGSPRMTVLSYSRVCASSLCNDISSMASILTPAPTVASSSGGSLCLACVGLGSSCVGGTSVVCPHTSRCYDGYFQLNGGGISSPVTVQGCGPRKARGCRLLGNTKALGAIAVTEHCDGDEDENGVSAVSGPAWGMAAGLLLALWGCLPQL